MVACLGAAPLGAPRLGEAVQRRWADGVGRDPLGIAEADQCPEAPEFWAFGQALEQGGPTQGPNLRRAHAQWRQVAEAAQDEADAGGLTGECARSDAERGRGGPLQHREAFLPGSSGSASAGLPASRISVFSPLARSRRRNALRSDQSATTRSASAAVAGPRPAGPAAGTTDLEFTLGIAGALWSEVGRSGKFGMKGHMQTTRCRGFPDHSDRLSTSSVAEIGQSSEAHCAGPRSGPRRRQDGSTAVVDPLGISSSRSSQLWRVLRQTPKRSATFLADSRCSWDIAAILTAWDSGFAGRAAHCSPRARAGQCSDDRAQESVAIVRAVMLRGLREWVGWASHSDDQLLNMVTPRHHGRSNGSRELRSTAHGRRDIGPRLQPGHFHGVCCRRLAHGSCGA